MSSSRIFVAGGLRTPFVRAGAAYSAKWLMDKPSGTLAVVSICADGGQGAVVLLCKP